MIAPDLTLRAAARSDLPAVLALHAQPAMDDGEVLPVDVAEALFERIQRYPDYRLYVACVERRVLGSFSLLIMDKLGHMGAPSAVVEDVLVDPAWQGHGIGKQMMHHARAVAADCRCYKLVLSSKTSRTAAHAFYESLGYDRYGYSFGIDPAQEDGDQAVTIDRPYPSSKHV